MQNLTCLLVAVVAFVSTGCVSSNYVRLGDETFPPREKDHVVEVFLSTDAPVVVLQSVSNAKSVDDVPSTAKMIGRVDTHGAPAASWSSIIADAKKKAREIGGDGLVIGRWGNYVQGVDSYGVAHHGKVLSMQIIRYRP